MTELYEWIGYIGSILVAWSITLQNLRRLRQLNLLGASVFTVYGILVEAWPVALVNGFIAVVNVWSLSQWQRKGREAFELVPFDSGHPFVARFMHHFNADMTKYFPHLSTSASSFPADACCEFVYRDMVPSGLFVHRKVSEEEREIYLDYVTPSYRDFKTAEFLYERITERFIRSGIKRLTARSSQDEHRAYLQRIGFKRQSHDSELFVLVIGSEGEL